MPLTHTTAFSQLDNIADDALVQLVYVSSLTLRSRLSASIFDEVECHAKDFNEQHGITAPDTYILTPEISHSQLFWSTSGGSIASGLSK